MPHAYLSNTIAKLSLHCALGRHDMWHLKLACGAACRLFEFEPSQIGPLNFISRSATACRPLHPPPPLLPPRPRAPPLLYPWARASEATAAAGAGSACGARLGRWLARAARGEQGLILKL